MSSFAFWRVSRTAGGRSVRVPSRRIGNLPVLLFATQRSAAFFAVLRVCVADLFQHLFDLFRDGISKFSFGLRREMQAINAIR
jgi:hypothetical protein